jgi:hypothetical protein
VPEHVVWQVYHDPNGVYRSPERHGPDRQVRWRTHDDQVVKIVVDLTDGSVVSVWITRQGR